MMKISNRRIAAVVSSVGVLGAIVAGAATASPTPETPVPDASQKHPVEIEVFAPVKGDNAGIAGAGWFVDLSVRYDGGLAAAGFTGLQVTGPAAHANTAPFPGSFSTGQDDRLPGLVVLASTTNSTIKGFSGPGTNLANLFNLTGVTDRSKKGAEILDSWIVGAPIAGQDVDSTLTVAVIADLNHDGVYNDAPSVVLDANGDGTIDARDLEAIGVASKITTIPFHISGDPK
ncbi:hypothetical protein QK290_17990 [Pseudarthrobacter sp. AL07]|uniref:hypothetical protein n=2 Tax=unclassified Pseudarthrobacter TaxID=2647000 RepID=UPI00249CA767|nr:hypothetical protein [Pseudarthrobacter sp. AL20]MDI3196293.1 hypothetical protein [Pseudarthrobacter sp. AL20]MDI3210347.1 hypothetical protein [Pseudarthrobacter sp. AL07]